MKHSVSMLEIPNLDVDIVMTK